MVMVFSQTSSMIGKLGTPEPTATLFTVPVADGSSVSNVTVSVSVPLSTVAV